MRLGSPPNSDALRPGALEGPIIGRLWDPEIDHTSFAPDASLDLLFVGPPTNTPTPFGTLLCKDLEVATFAPAGAPLQVLIPDDLRLLGFPMTFQGASFGLAHGEYELTNALDVLVGSYRSDR